MLPEERNDHFQQVAPLSDGVLEQAFPMIVVTRVRIDIPDSEELSHRFQTGAATRALRHAEIMRKLISSPVASSLGSVRLPDQTNREAAFSVSETDDPVDCQ